MRSNQKNQILFKIGSARLDQGWTLKEAQAELVKLRRKKYSELVEFNKEIRGAA